MNGASPGTPWTDDSPSLMESGQNPIRTLIVDDDADIRELLVGYLSRFRVYADAVADGDALRERILQYPYDVIVLDLMLPGEDGLSLCRELRSRSDIPVIILSARGETADKVVGLELGADDYVVKPFDPRELVARIQSVLRRKPTEGGTREQEEVMFEGWRLHRVTRQLTTPDGLVVPLSNAEFRLLWSFIQRPNRVLNRDQLLDSARGKNAEAFDRSIDLLVSRLRSKLDDDPRAPKLLKTVRGEGYLFNARVGSLADTGTGKRGTGYES